MGAFTYRYEVMGKILDAPHGAIITVENLAKGWASSVRPGIREICEDYVEEDILKKTDDDKYVRLPHKRASKFIPENTADW